MNNNIFISEKNRISNRMAIFEETDTAGWFYLTEQNNTKPISDCWVYNKVKAPKFFEIPKYRPNPPPASIEFVGEHYLREFIEESQIFFKWSQDGNSVCMLLDRYPMGYIIFGEKHGYSRNLIKNCGWGNVFDENQYKLYFVDSLKEN